MRAQRPDNKRSEWPTELGAAVRRQRLALGLTQAEVARLSGCGTAFLYGVENSKPSLRLDKLADVLEVLGLRLTLEPGRGGIAVSERLK
ncbi:MAG: helix-turn-helix transcriptional regulator [Myxococcales bacterium]|nr:helix-turn-helix transcriptional regulator [Myxococcales bacterium]